MAAFLASSWSKHLPTQLKASYSHLIPRSSFPAAPTRPQPGPEAAEARFSDTLERSRDVQHDPRVLSCYLIALEVQLAN